MDGALFHIWSRRRRAGRRGGEAYRSYFHEKHMRRRWRRCRVFNHYETDLEVHAQRYVGWRLLS